MLFLFLRPTQLTLDLRFCAKQPSSRFKPPSALLVSSLLSYNPSNKLKSLHLQANEEKERQRSWKQSTKKKKQQEDNNK